MKQLEQAFSTAFSNIISSGLIEKAIEENIAKTVESTIREQLRSYSDFGKAIEERVKTALQVNFDNLGLPGYNDLILKIVRAQVDANVQSTLAAQVEKQMTELLTPAPAELTLSALVAEFIEDSKRYDNSGPDRITLIVEEDSSYSSTKFHHIYLDKEEGQGKYECHHRIDVHNGKMYNVLIGKQDPDKKLFVGSLYGFERRIFQLYAAGTKLIVDGDEDSINTYYPGRDY
ncbi:hypothetical protein WT88_29490 [Burkholderia stagnalis]|uniref:hypothetical protein n=1 Tax=Burkholderia stagnalis TaxID=1503054 RepID=UPI000755E90D|nr:hypothetical protein [Burkholderia stagnalis]KVZ18618.1 hypothetical protein WT35_04430 [Burkholderia stagnalis]KWN32841.1 hypothetical protein WT86_18555 [Burkholderia stagnalis]KWN44668.1 hypothetical protein WT88_29490 [Burkholderia stagnalis]KWN54401.1 hypothetical protein WT87_03585 [Burkholderia stagnalis]KWO68808.1 hypothetical protein WT99_20955 [Burkholderia stagnalis]